MLRELMLSWPWQKYGVTSRRPLGFASLRLEAGTLPLMPLLVTKANQSQASSQETESTLPYASIEAPAGGVTVTAERSKELCVVVSCGAVSKGEGGIGGRKTPKGHQGTDIKVGR